MKKKKQTNKKTHKSNGMNYDLVILILVSINLALFIGLIIFFCYLWHAANRYMYAL